MLTADQFHKLYPRAVDPQGWVDDMSDLFDHYEVNTPERIAAFLSQCAHESCGWSVFSENLNYSAASLRKVFGKYFPTDAIAAQYARKPQAIANRVYANRMGNGDEASGDGWKYRGRGPIQLTGFKNYLAFAHDTFTDQSDVDVMNDPDEVADNRKIAIMSALWFWNLNSLNDQADADNLKELTRRINGGYNGLEDRVAQYEAAIQLLA